MSCHSSNRNLLNRFCEHTPQMVQAICGPRRARNIWLRASSAGRDYQATDLCPANQPSDRTHPSAHSPAATKEAYLLFLKLVFFEFIFVLLLLVFVGRGAGATPTPTRAARESTRNTSTVMDFHYCQILTSLHGPTGHKHLSYSKNSQTWVILIPIVNISTYLSYSTEVQNLCADCQEWHSVKRNPVMAWQRVFYCPFT